MYHISLPLNLKSRARAVKQMRFSKIMYYLVFSIFVVVSLGLSGTQSHAATYLKIGLPEGPRTLNIWLASDRGSHR